MTQHILCERSGTSLGLAGGEFQPGMQFGGGILDLAEALRPKPGRPWRFSGGK